MLKFAKTRKQKAWVVSGIAFALVLCCAGVVYFDYGKINEEQDKTVSLNNQLSGAKSRIAKIPDIENRVLMARHVVKEMVTILPNDSDITSFVDRITEFAKASGVAIESLDDKSARTRKSRKRTREAFVKIVYKMVLRGTVSELLDFLHSFETHDRFVSVNQFSISAAKPTKKDIEEGRMAKHSIDLELETYVYNPPQAENGDVVEIPEDKKKLDNVLRNSPASDMLQLATYNYVPNPDRKDPFSDPRWEEGGNSEEGNVALEEQKKNLEDLIASFTEINAGVETESKLTDMVQLVEFTTRLNNLMMAFMQRVAEVKENKQITHPDLRERFKTEIEEPFNLLLAKRPPIAAHDFRLNELKIQYKKMLAAFTEQRHQDVMSTCKTIWAHKPEIVEGELAELYEKIKRVWDRSEARHEFAQKQFHFSGYVFQPSDRNNAVIIINDRAYSPGDVMDDGVVIRSVDPAKVVFLFKEEEIARSIE